MVPFSRPKRKFVLKSICSRAAAVSRAFEFLPSRSCCFSTSQPMKTTHENAVVKSVALVTGRGLVSFTDGAAALFDAEFLYAHRNKNGNIPLRLNQDAGGL